MRDARWVWTGLTDGAYTSTKTGPSPSSSTLLPPPPAPPPPPLPYSVHQEVSSHQRFQIKGYRASSSSSSSSHQRYQIKRIKLEGKDLGQRHRSSPNQRHQPRSSNQRHQPRSSNQRHQARSSNQRHQARSSNQTHQAIKLDNMFIHPSSACSSAHSLGMTQGRTFEQPEQTLSSQRSLGEARANF